MRNDRSHSTQRLDTQRLIGFIGGYLVDQGTITLEQLDQALIQQVELALQGEKLSIGQVLQRLGYVTPQELARAARRQQHDMTNRTR